MFLKQNVLSLVLNVSTVSALLIYSGIEFHNFGAVAEKARPPYELDLIDGMHNNERVDDLSVLDGWYSCIIGSK